MNAFQGPVEGFSDPFCPAPSIAGNNALGSGFNNNAITFAPALLLAQGVLTQQDTVIFCTQFPCPVTFQRDADRIRHDTAVHGINKVLPLCPVVGYNKARGEAIVARTS